MEIVEMKIESLVPYENNPRNNDNAVDAVAASIREFGFKVPIVVDKDNVIVAGHTRLKAAKKLGLKAVPAIIADDLTEEQVKAFRLADNKAAELAMWDFSKLDEELANIDMDMSEFGFEENDDWFHRSEFDGAKRQDGNEEYNEFLEKFEPKKTTDDCYTPDNIYNAVVEFVETEYGLNRSNFVRPFYPGGDYEAEKYKPTDIVVDNPPFSILSQIIKFYSDNGIKFFLFAPALTLFSSASASSATALCANVEIRYENGAKVLTSFLTNLEKENIRLKSAPKLYSTIKSENDKNLKEARKELKVHDYPLYVVTAAKVGLYSKYGIDFEVKTDESARVRQLDAQKESGDAIYGSAYFISEAKKAEREKAEREKAEREKAEREKAERWELSQREIEIIESLGK